MFRAFNMGVGMVALVPAAEAAGVVGALCDAGETAWVAGEVVAGDGGVQLS